MSSKINWYPGHMAKTKRQIKEVIGLIDVVYEVIDARMPKSSKVNDLDEIVKNKPKILILSKKDLCDMNITKKWMDSYEKAGYNVIAVDLTKTNDYKKIIELTEYLVKPMQEERKKKGLKHGDIKVLVVGIPNVGKSTLINKLSKRKVQTVGNKPGVTKSINWLNTGSGILLLDTPGILDPNLDDNDAAMNLASLASINSNILNLTDIGSYIVTYLKNYYPNILKNIYGDVYNDDPIEILKNIAIKYNYTIDNEVDYDRVCERVYNDLVSGKIKGVTFDQWM